MKWLLLTAVLFIATPASAQVTINNQPAPVAQASGTVAFTCAVVEGGGCTWTCPGCAGSINSGTGLYTAPATIHSSQSYGGYQLLPNDHIYNTRIDGLAVDSHSAAWIAGSGTTPFSLANEISFPINYIDGTTPTQSQVFYFTPGNNGTFQIPQYPLARIESGWMNRASLVFDHHFFSIDTTNGTMQEMYQYYYPTFRRTVDGCPTCTADSGIRYANSTYNLPNSQGGSTDAAGLYVMPLELRLQEVEQAIATSGTINHALRMSLGNNNICASSLANACGNNAVGTRHIWPATSEAFIGSGIIPYGARFRLKTSFNIAGFSSAAQIILTALKNYGLILADGGTGWASQVELTRWPTSVMAVLTEITNAGIAPSNFEAVDESSLMVSLTSGATTSSETVIATGITNPAHTASQQVVLTGVTVTLPKDELYIQAGTSAQQFSAYIRGSSNLGLTWSMSPSVGTLTGAGLYTPPATVGAATVTTVKATSTADSGVAAQMTVTIFPTGSIYLVLGRTSAYTDTNGHVWQNKTGADGCNDVDLLDLSGSSPWTANPNLPLYYVRCAGADLRFDLAVPNGYYNVTGKFAAGGSCTAGVQLQDIEAQGVIDVTNFDICALAGSLTPFDHVTSATVTNGTLSYVLRNVAGSSANTIRVQAVQIDSALPPGTTLTPGMTVTSGVTVK